MGSHEPEPTRRKGNQAIDAVGILLRQVREFHRLTAEEEIALIRAYKEGLKARRKFEKGKNPDSNLLALIKLGEDAQQKIIGSHLPLVIKVAKFYYQGNRTYVDFGDLIGAGNEGSVIALQRFNPARRNKFSTYAYWWIRKRIAGEIKQNRWTMRIPDEIYRAVTKLLRLKAYFQQQYSREPTIR